MKRFAIALIIFSCGLAVFTSSAESAGKGGIKISASVDRRSIYIGDRIRYLVEVLAPKDTLLQFPQFKDYRIGEFEIKDSGSSVKPKIFGRVLYKRSYLITTYTVGKKVIPEYEVKWKAKSGKDWIADKTKPIEISVKSVLPVNVELTDIKDIKGPLYFRNPYWGIISLAVVLLLCLAIAYIIYMRMKSYVPVRLPHETALEELESIRARYLQGGPIKEYYFGVSDSVRRYIERAFNLRAPEMTTEEFLNSMKDSSGLNGAQKDLLRGFMNACDMVKYAKYNPTAAEADSVYSTAKNFILESSGELDDELKGIPGGRV